MTSFSQLKESRQNIVNQQRQEERNLSSATKKSEQDIQAMAAVRKELIEKRARKAQLEVNLLQLDLDMNNYRATMLRLHEELNQRRIQLREEVVRKYDTRINVVEHLIQEPDFKVEHALEIIEANFLAKLNELNAVYQEANNKYIQAKKDLDGCKRNIIDQEKMMRLFKERVDPNIVKNLANNKGILPGLEAAVQTSQTQKENKENERRVRYQSIKGEIENERTLFDISSEPESSEIASGSDQLPEISSILDEINQTKNPEDQMRELEDTVREIENLEEKQAREPLLLAENTRKIEERKLLVEEARQQVIESNQITARNLEEYFTKRARSVEVLDFPISDPANDPDLFNLVLQTCARIEVEFNIDITGNFDEVTMSILAEGLSSPDFRLKKLSIKNTGINDRGFQLLFNALNKNPAYLQELNISKNSIEQSGSQALSEYLSNANNVLRVLNFSKMESSFNHDVCSAIGVGLRNNHSLITLDFSGNNSQGVAGFYFDFMSNARFLPLFEETAKNTRLALQTLILDYTPCMREQVVVTELLKIVKNSKKHIKLSLVNTRLNDSTAGLFFSGLAKLQENTIKSLDVRSNTFSSKEAIDAFLKFILADRVQDINFNVKDEWAKQIPNVLRNVKNISSICIQADEQNNGALTVLDILDVIGSRARLQTFDLNFGTYRNSDKIKGYFKTYDSFYFSGAFVNPNNMAAFLEYLRCNPTVVSILDLSRCNFTTTDLDNVLHIFSEFPNLQGLNLSYNRIDRIGCGNLLRATEDLTQLRYICLQGNQLNAQDAEELLISENSNRVALAGQWDIREIFPSKNVTYDEFTRTVRGAINAVRTNINIEKIDWSDRGLSIDELKVLLGQWSNSVKKINLRNNSKLGNDCLEVLTNYIRTKFTSLVSLNLTNVGINLASREAMILYQDFLQAAKNLKELKMDENKLYGINFADSQSIPPAPPLQQSAFPS